MPERFFQCAFSERLRYQQQGPLHNREYSIKGGDNGCCPIFYAVSSPKAADHNLEKML
jgi:hypothetical protein